jgi:hypothetical protein
MKQKSKESYDTTVAMEQARANIQILLGVLLATGEGRDVPIVDEKIHQLAEQGLKENLEVIVAKTSLMKV